MALCFAEDIAALAYRQAGSKNKSYNQVIGIIAIRKLVSCIKFRTLRRVAQQAMPLYVKQ